MGEQRSVPHTATSRSGDFDSHPIAPGASYTYVTTHKGEIVYTCTLHPTMTGTINVVAGPPVDSALVQVGAGNALVFSPSTVTIHAGGYVRWINVSTMTNHTVTRQ